ncbi:MAG TPA: glycosyltransferase family 1 protein [Blastocatellia bacterium]|nr:glycosyltransferase family 1 protein [Blastocatellia bacterium]
MIADEQQHLGAKVGLVATETFDDPTGIGTYTRQLAMRLAGRVSEFVCVRDEKDETPQFLERTLVLPRSLNLGAIRRIAAPFYMAWKGFDLLHFPSEPSLYLLRSGRARTLVTVHGLASIRLPAELHERLPRRAQLKYKHLLETVERVITVSESSRRDIIDVYEIAPERISVIYNGIDEIFSSDPSDLPVLDVGDRPYILSVCATIPKKNVSAIVRTLAALKERGLPHRLIHIGPRGAAQEALEAEVRRFNLRTDVSFLGYVSKNELAAYYRGADALLFPSFHEGFGIPIVEAMASGCPVVTSTAFSMPEIAGDAALLVDPYNVESLIAVTHRLLTNRSLRDEMIELGVQRARRFSWNRCADETVAVYSEVLNG